MKVDVGNHVVYLSRTNLLALLAKLDGNPPNSARTILKQDDETGAFWMVVAQSDDEHYGGRIRGPMHPATEAAIQ